MTSNLSIDFLLWQQHDDHAMSPKGYASQRPSSGRTGSMLSSGLISSRIAQGIFAIRGSSWRRWCAIGWTPMTSPGVRSLNIIRIPRAAWLAMSRLFTQARTCRRACTVTHLSLPLPHREGLSTLACDLALALLFPAFSQLISDRSFVEQ
jgi:hypothetical protein